VRLKPAAQRQRDAEEVMADVRARIDAQVPEVRIEFVQVLQDVLNDLAGNPRPIEIKLFGNDYAKLKAVAQDVGKRIESVAGLVDIDPGFEGQAPELRVEIDSAVAARVGTTAEAIAAELDTSLHGMIASSMPRADRPLDVRVRYPDAVRFDTARIAQLPMRVGSGSLTRLSALANIVEGGSETVLVREGLRPAMIITGAVEGGDLGEVTLQIRARLEKMSMPEGVTWELDGAYEGQKATIRSLLRVMAFGILAVLGVLLAQFARTRLALIVLTSVPLAVVGALLTLWLTGVPLNASSLMGCVLLVGLVVKNGILLLEQYELSLAAGLDISDALMEAGSIRLRPILMTTLATIAGLAPLAFGIGSGAQIQRPLAVAVIGGLFVATAVSLLVLPALVRLISRGPGAGDRPTVASGGAPLAP
jgi:multidrug efflux pump subunit AcrB